MIRDIKNECPFCGSRDTQLVYAGEEIFFVKCVSCGATGSRKFSEATAIMAWNSANLSKLQKLKRVTDIVNG